MRRDHEPQGGGIPKDRSGRVGVEWGRRSFVEMMVGVNQNVDRRTKVNRIAQEKTRGKDYEFVVVVTCQEDDEEAEKNQREKPKEERNAISTIPAKPKRKTKRGGRLAKLTFLEIVLVSAGEICGVDGF